MGVPAPSVRSRRAPSVADIAACARVATLASGRRLLVVALVAAASVSPALGQGELAPGEQLAWSENAGWLNLAPAHGAAVQVLPDHLVGFVWGENVGWISLGAAGGGPYANAGATDWGVNRAPDGKLSGFAWSETVGWIAFASPHGEVTLDAGSGRFDGFGWSENAGWISFRGPGYGAVTNAGAFFSIDPCRALDTRQPGQGPAIPSGTPRELTLPGACGIPSTAVAVALNVTVTQPTGTGHLVLSRSGAAVPATSTINFAAGQTRANNAIVQLSLAGAMAILPQVSGAGSVHVVVDVVGFFE